MKPVRRNHAGYLAFLLHRISGLGLALFLPFHFLVLGLALERDAALDGFLSWTDLPLVKAAEVTLVVLLALHMAGGLRLLSLEFLPWFDRQKTLIFGTAGLAVILGAVFLARLA